MINRLFGALAITAASYRLLKCELEVARFKLGESVGILLLH